jgi:hypothetical protein
MNVEKYAQKLIYSPKYGFHCANVAKLKTTQ